MAAAAASVSKVAFIFIYYPTVFNYFCWRNLPAKVEENTPEELP